MTKEEELEHLGRQRREIDARIYELQQQIRNEKADFKIGDLVEWNHSEKSIRRGRVIGHSLWGPQVRVIRKDGSDGVCVEIYSPQRQKPRLIQSASEKD